MLQKLANEKLFDKLNSYNYLFINCSIHSIPQSYSLDTDNGAQYAKLS